MDTKKTYGRPLRIEDYGLSEENPILLDSIAASYVFCRKLADFEEEIYFKRLGSIGTDHFPKLMDAYEFRRKDKLICRLFIYPYHSENIGEVPTPFHQLEDFLEEVYMQEAMEEDMRGELGEEWDEEPEMNEREWFSTLVYSCLAKNGIGRKGEAIAPDPAAKKLFLAGTHHLSEAERNSLERDFLAAWRSYAATKIRPNVSFFLNGMFSGE